MPFFRLFKIMGYLCSKIKIILHKKKIFKIIENCCNVYDFMVNLVYEYVIIYSNNITGGHEMQKTVERIGIIGVAGKNCLVDVRTKKVNASVTIVKLDMRVVGNKIFISEKDSENSIFEIEYQDFRIEDLNLFEQDGTEIRININDDEYIEVVSLVD